MGYWWVLKKNSGFLFQKSFFFNSQISHTLYLKGIYKIFIIHPILMQFVSLNGFGRELPSSMLTDLLYPKRANKSQISKREFSFNFRPILMQVFAR